MDQRTPMAARKPARSRPATSWGAFADDQLGLMDHLGIREFFCIGGCFAGKLLQRAPDRVVAAVFCQDRRAPTG
jgi:pimeloyl-ACP methyl ester carboxylesterase